MPFFNRFGSVNTKNFGLSKSSGFRFEAIISANVQNYNVRTAALAGGWDGTTRLLATVTVNAGVYVWTDTTSTAAFVTGSMPAGSTVNIVNNGFIMGKGGHAGQNAGPAIDLLANVNITNNSYIAGGGGGGASITTGSQPAGGGGGAGGGNGGSTAASAGGAGGAPGQSGSNGTGTAGFGGNFWGIGGGGGGGRILPGNGGRGAFGTYFTGRIGSNASAVLTFAGLGGGAGGGGGKYNGFGISPTFQTGVQTAAGGGGGWGAAGGLAITGTYNLSDDVVNSGAGGSASAAGFNSYVQATDGAAGTRGLGGKAINLNGYAVTYITTGNIYGAVS